MRTREEIEAIFDNTGTYKVMLSLILEVILDIRDILTKNTEMQREALKNIPLR